ncbi:MAG TPA: excinuclease ABC subunit UvrA [Patescibacteria group bacterium]|nr:excinuclease ABC subunit UvrA [Patescibacteria group bacterium]
MDINTIKVRGARQHNLKNVNLDIPKNKLIVFTGVSGSGKSSLAFDTIYAEGQRRYVESLSTYARQFLGIMEKPDVDLIEGLSPAISIDQKTTSKNPRSTVGTVTEIYDYLRLLFARIGHPHCPICGDEISRQGNDQIVEKILDVIKSELTMNKRIRLLILSPVVRSRKGEFSSLLKNLKAKGYIKIRIDNIVKDTDGDLFIIKTNKHTIDAIIDRISFSQKDYKNEIFYQNLKSRISDSVEQALNLSDGLVIASVVLDKTLDMPEYPKDFKDHLYSERFSCPKDNIQIPEIEPRTFSFNSPQGACEKCLGLGKILKVAPEMVFSKALSIKEGGIIPFSNLFEGSTWFSRLVLTFCHENGIDPTIPIGTLDKEKLDLILNGTVDKVYEVYGQNRFGEETVIHERFVGIIAELEKRHRETESDWVRMEIEKYMREYECEGCKGYRLKKEALAVTIDKKSIAEVCLLPIDQCLEFITLLSEDEKVLSDLEKKVGNLILKELILRLTFLLSVGLEYLNLSRPSATLSGGEAQRIRLASQIGSGLTGVLYVLDEPTIGLHQKDNDKLIDTLKKLRDIGNTVIVVEHDENMIRSADFVYDFGPGAGKYGGRLVASGTPHEIINNPDSITGKYLSGNKKIDINYGKTIEMIKPKSKVLKVYGASQYNLKSIDVSFPLGKLVAITGVSGSGKSTLLVETLYPAIASKLNDRFKMIPGKHKNIEGVENVNKVILIDQSPIGRTPRSNPATYTKLFDEIRDLFSKTKDSKSLGFKKGRFSFNLKGGRCETCEGQGQIKIEMQFMSDIWITCDVCGGKRYNSQTLEVQYKGKNISEVLDMTVDEALEFFHSNPKILSKLETLKSVGLGYIELGQPATTLSGGEAQRVKLATELGKRETGNTVYILDEPTTGLHFADVEKLLHVLKLLVTHGNSVFVIEHNLDVIRNADWIIDLGPDGGDKGGYLVAEGDPAFVKTVKASYTSAYI